MSRSLYALILGAAWKGLDARLKGFFAASAAAGAFSVRRGQGPIARLIGWMLRLPDAGNSIPIRLLVEIGVSSETWHREIGAVTFVTVQTAISEGLLAERFGVLEFRLRVEADATNVRFRQVGAAFTLGRLGLPLPRWLAPCVEALMHVEAGDASPRVSVALRAPWVGLLMAYEGPIAAVERA
jgi:hypothetical protein